MKRQSFILLLFLLFSGIILANNNAGDTIQVAKKGGTIFLLDGKPLTPKQMLVTTKINPEAYKEMKAAKSNYDAAMVFAYAGGFLIGYPIGTAIGGGDANWGMAGIGAGLLLITIPLGSAYNKRAKNAVRLYNQGIITNKELSRIDFKMGFNGSGLSVKMMF